MGQRKRVKSSVLQRLKMKISSEHLTPKSETPNPLLSAQRGTTSTSSEPAKHSAFMAKNQSGSCEIASRRLQMKQMDAEFETMDRT